MKNSTGMDLMMVDALSLQTDLVPGSGPTITSSSISREEGAIGIEEVSGRASETGERTTRVKTNEKNSAQRAKGISTSTEAMTGTESTGTFRGIKT